VIPALIKTNRFVLALAHHASHSAGNGAAEAGALGGRSTKATRGRGAATRRRTACATATDLLTTLPGNAAGGRNWDKVLPGDRVFVLLADVAPLDERVNAGGQCLGLRAVEPNRTDVLLAAEDELGFFLALGLVTPHRHRDGHQDRHHRERDEQRRHCIACLAACFAEAVQRRRREAA
jgi:hypothetical protein